MITGSVARRHPEWLWQDIEPYKTGFMAREYAADLPEDIHAGETGVAAIDGLIALLKREGYLHNHGRMYLAAYIVHWRRVSWQAGHGSCCAIWLMAIPHRIIFPGSG